jgi:protein-L-isoaspartate(D-aspartate) O-methyltransferase
MVHLTSSCSAAQWQKCPQTLLDQLKVGGRLVAIVGNEPMMQATVMTRASQTELQHRQPWDTTAPRLLNFPGPA